MEEDNILSIPVESISFSETEDDRISKLRLKLNHSGLNNNNSNITLDALKEAIVNNTQSIIGMPILAGFEKDYSDVTEHVEDEQVVGIIPQIDHNIKLEQEDGTDRVYVYIDGYLYNYYSKNLLEIFEKEKDLTKKISIEIEVLDGYKDKKTGVYMITSFKYLGVTILGNKFGTGMKKCHATLEFSQQEKLNELSQFLNEYFSKKNKYEFIKQEDIGKSDSIKIDLSKESADNGDWGSVNKTSLRNQILSAKNYKALVKACYLVVENEYENTPSEKLKYPVCKISNNKLVLSIKGCENALGFLEKNTEESYYSTAKSKLKKYYKKLGLSTENFNENNLDNKDIKEDIQDMFKKEEFVAKFGLTCMQMYEELYKTCCSLETYEDEYWGGTYSRYGLMDYDDMNVYVRDYKDNKICGIPFSMEGDNPMLKHEEMFRAKCSYSKWEDGEDEDDCGVDCYKEQFEQAKQKYEESKQETKTLKSEIETIKNDLDVKKEDFSKQLNEKADALITLNTEHEELKTKFSELEVEKNNILTSKEEIITNKEKEIQQFKDSLEKYKSEEKKETINQIIKEFSNILSKEEIDTFMEKSKSIEDIESFRTEIKLFVCDKVTSNINNGKQANFSSMALLDNEPKNPIEDSKDKTIWDKLREKNNK